VDDADLAGLSLRSWRLALRCGLYAR
jgi:hypothetical protein